MAHADGHSLQRAPQVCSHCKSIKKGCDKKLPSCSQCVKRKAICRYGEPEERRRSGYPRVSLEASPARNIHPPTAWTTIPSSVRSKLCPPMRLSLLLMSSLSDVFSFDPLDSKSSHLSADTDSVLSSQVCNIIRTDGTFIDDIVLQFFGSIHRWLPIMSRKRFHDRLAHFKTTPRADFSILLLVMQLITQHPSSDLETDREREVLYLASKTMFAKVQAFIPWSLYLVQAGVILARYEHSHGMVEAAYITVGTCARLAYAMGLHEKKYSLELQRSDAWLEEEEMLCTWWGLVVCDRSIACDSQMHGRPFATRLVREEDYLPLEPKELDEDSGGGLMEPNFRYFVSATSLPGVGSFGREAQAIYLYDKVRSCIERGETSESVLYPLGRELQNLLGMVMEQEGRQWDSFCGAIQMIITSLYTVHRTAAMQPAFDADLRYKETIRAALNTITRMVIDIAYAYNLKSVSFDIDAICPSVAHIVQCTQQHILTARNFNDPKWMEDFEQLRKVLSFCNQRWAIAGMELRRLNETAQISMALQI